MERRIIQCRISKTRRRLMPFPRYDAKIAAMQHGRHGRRNTPVVKSAGCWCSEIISVHSADRKTVKQMADWILASRCPHCGGRMTAMEHFALTHDYRVRLDGRPSQRFSRSPEGPLDCITVLCEKCRTVWDSDHAAWDADGIFIKGDGNVPRI